MKNTVDGINSRINEADEKMKKWAGHQIAGNHCFGTELRKEMWTVQETSGTALNVPAFAL